MCDFVVLVAYPHEQWLPIAHMAKMEKHFPMIKLYTLQSVIRMQ